MIVTENKNVFKNSMKYIQREIRVELETAESIMVLIPRISRAFTFSSELLHPFDRSRLWAFRRV